MNNSFIKTYCFLVLYAFIFGADCPSIAKDIFQWSELPALPPTADQERQPGLAGPFVGVHKDALIVAGGMRGAQKHSGHLWRTQKKTEVYTDLVRSLAAGAVHQSKSPRTATPRGVCFSQSTP